VERVHLTIGDRIYKYFSYKNTYGYVDILPKIVKANNVTVHSTTGMAPSQVTDSDVLAILKRMVAGRRVAFTSLKQRCFTWGSTCTSVRRRWGSPRLPNGFQHRDIQDRERNRDPAELEDLNGTHINGQFNREELTPVRITERTAYKINKILDKRVRRHIREYPCLLARLQRGLRILGACK